MAEETKPVHGTLDGVTVQVTEETAEALGSSFEADSKAKSSKSSK